ncbi:MAG: FHA domain-containing protein [Burkholderiaceae bacterium]
MPKLILSMDGLVLKEVELTKERTSIGRRPHNDIVIDNLAVSGEHAVLITILNDSFIEDLGSTNGTTVNGQPIKKHFLQGNDTVELGKYKLKFVVDAKPESGYGKIGVREESGGSVVLPRHLSSTAMTRTVPGGSTTGVNAAADPQRVAPTTRSRFGEESMTNGAAVSRPAPASAAASPAATIQILNGPNAGKELMLSKALTTLGRPGVQVAVITRRQQGYYITHVEGSSFPVVNGKALGLDATALTDHDIIELSGTKMEFFFR